MGAEPCIPVPKCVRQLVVEGFRSGLQQKMGTPQRPLHLLLLDEAPAHHLIDRRFYERRADGFALPSALVEIGNELAVVADVGLEFSNTIGNLLAEAECASIKLSSIPNSSIRLQRLVCVAVPQQMLDTLQPLGDISSSLWPILYQCFGLLLENRQPHGDVEPIDILTAI